LGLQLLLTISGLRPVFQQLDITSSEDIAQFRDHVAATYGGLDILVNNAAIAYKGASTAPFSEQARVTVETNFFGTLHVCQVMIS
jgi:carbonyl reductase 1